MAQYQLGAAGLQEVDSEVGSTKAIVLAWMQFSINYWVTSDLAILSTLSFCNDRFYDYRVQILHLPWAAGLFQNFDLSLKACGRTD